MLRCENLDVTNRPGLHVIPRPCASAEGRFDVMAFSYVDLGSLKGNKGDQNYDVPAGTDVSSGDRTVIVRCQPFPLIFATATLSAREAESHIQQLTSDVLDSDHEHRIFG